ncbi:unnamed protein product [Schistosoma margrebowiei]|uniref:Uncharacterized protein n=1 Tax=Schistosoma margrebowiei TaxID=48269 RepID=A0A183LEX7_9TREM|nr:unnamed protein product [Schistosoma margrebowiei]
MNRLSGIMKKEIQEYWDFQANVIQCYAPTNDSNDDIKDQFYERLQSVIEKCPRKDLTILMGDINAKVGIDNAGYEDIMGQHGLGVRNENGERFANLCAFNKLVIGGTIFPHKRIHKATWISPDPTTENQIDHICINKKFRRTMEDVRTRRGADVASDHHLVVANLKLKLKKNWTSGQTALHRFNTAFLRDTDKLNEFKIAFNNRFQALQDLLKEEETSMEDNWKGIKEALTSTDAFQVRTGVRQGCLLPPFLFLLVIDWIMKTSTSEGKHGIQWTARNQLDDLDFADDLALLSRTHEQMQMKTASVAAVSA